MIVAAKRSTVLAAVLAAGASHRLGRPKQLLDLHGRPLVATIAAAALAACDRVGVVIGASAGAVSAAVAGLPVDVLPNLLWPEGIASSIRCAVAWAMRCGADALMLLVCDQPRVSSAHLRALIDAHEAHGGTIASRYAGILGVPALVDRAAFPLLFALHGDAGARAVLATCRARAIEWPDGAIDVDVPGDVANCA